ncbi:MAG: NUDIX hydrolase [Pseudomonadales bacterium]
MSAADDADGTRRRDAWLNRVRRLRAIAQTGSAYTTDGYDLERFRELGELAETLLADLTAAAPERIRDLYLPERGYPTPKLDVRAGVFVEEGGTARVLLVRERADGRWSLPGGWADEQESPRQSIEREVEEESGYRVRAQKLVALRDRALHGYRPQRLEHVYKLLFLCELSGGAPATSLETTEVGFFGLDALPELSRGRTLAQDIELLDRHRRQPGLPTTFD